MSAHVLGLMCRGCCADPMLRWKFNCRSQLQQGVGHHGGVLALGDHDRRVQPLHSALAGVLDLTVWVHDNTLPQHLLLQHTLLTHTA